jgi:glycosyltransferase involved in cell wall biosynthesis
VKNICNSISVVIPLYNKGKHIERAVISVLNQKYPNFELIVVDDGSTDMGPDKVQSINDHRVRLIRQGNSGVSSARNKGVKEAVYEYVAFLDADDEWHIDFLKTINELINAYPEAGAYSTNYYIKELGKAPKRANIKCFNTNLKTGLIPNYFKSVYRGNSPIWASAVCIPKHVFYEVGFFPEDVVLYEDLYLWSKIALRYRLVFCVDPLATYYKDASNRACNDISKIGPFPAFAEIKEKISQPKTGLNIYWYFKLFVGKYALIDALKCLYSGEKRKAFSLIRFVSIFSIKQAFGKLFIIVAIFFPQKWIRLVFLYKRKILS